MVDFSDEKFLLDEIRKGNNQAFEYLFKAYYPVCAAMLFVSWKMKKRLVILFKSASCVSGRSRALLSAVSVTSLLFAMVRNGCLNYLKHLSIVEKHQIEYLASIDGEERLYYADFTLDAEHKLLYDELQEQINLVIGQLPERSREIFLMSRFKGLKNREIADKLQISTTAVEKHIAKALKSFSKHFKDKYPVDIYIMIVAWVIMNNK